MGDMHARRERPTGLIDNLQYQGQGNFAYREGGRGGALTLDCARHARYAGGPRGYGPTLEGLLRMVVQQAQEDLMGVLRSTAPVRATP